MNQENLLIGKYDSKFKSDEVIYEDFISRKEFINRTRIYISTMFYDLVYNDFKESGLSVDEYVDTYEKNHPIMETELKGTFKCNVIDDSISGLGTYDNLHEPNIWEIVNAVDMELYHKWVHGDKTISQLLDIIEKQEKIISDVKSILYDIQKEKLASEKSNGVVA